MAKRSRNLNNEGSKKYMPDGRVTFKIMVGKRDDGKPKMLQVYQRKGETPKETKERFEEELRKYRAANELSSSLEMFDLVREGGDALLGEYLKQYIKDFKEATVKPTTLAYYYNLLNMELAKTLDKNTKYNVVIDGTVANVKGVRIDSICLGLFGRIRI